MIAVEEIQACREFAEITFFCHEQDRSVGVGESESVYAELARVHAVFDFAQAVVEGRCHPSPLFDRAGAAEYLATTERQIQDLWNRRQIPAIKVGRKVRFHKDDLDRYINERRTS